MNKHFLLHAVIAFALCSQSLAALAQSADRTFVPANDSQIVYMGRVSHRNPSSPCFTYPGVSIIANFEGTSLTMKAKPNSGYFMVEIDNQSPYKIGFGENDSIQILAEALPKGVHTARIMYVIEGYQLRPEFRGFYLNKGCKLAQAPGLPARKIEFIGNSITCGYGVEATDASMPFSNETENHYYTYAAITARTLKAQHLVVARSGIGIYRNYNGPRTGSPDCMPAMYEQTLFSDPSETWDHSLYTPDVVCVNLGTNDTSTDNYDTKLLTQAYRNFLKTLRGHYPQAKIVFLTGTMLSEKPAKVVKTALNTVVAEAKQQGDTNLYRFDMSPQTGALGMGASYHPSLRQQQKMANELTAFLKTITGWD
ncbi:SGNH/GDSL hydrolase family protein [Bacteroides sp.]|uniref:SGNH/GDSL hydrolase family protein n=1 Tax=Bacteroides sp. TaxID=29523 RepID=UPI003AB443D5